MTADPRFPALAACIGSFPHSDPEAVVRFLLETLPECPAWPQLPRLSHRENMYAQYAGPLPGARIDAETGKTRLVLPDDPTEVLTRFFDAALEPDAGTFRLQSASAAGYHAFLDIVGEIPEPDRPLFVKGHVTGPVSFGLTVTRADDRSVFYDETLRDVVVHGLAAQARAQVRELARLGRPVVLFVDEPYLSAYGSGTVPLSEQDVAESLEPVVSAILQEGGIAGVHCCGNTDWSLLFGTSAHIVSFDAYSYLEGMALYPEALNAFLARGGALAWGIVPTEPQALERETAEALVDRFWAGVEALVRGGARREALLRSFLVTPSCGTGTLPVDLAERAISLTAHVSARIKETIASSGR